MALIFIIENDPAISELIAVTLSGENLRSYASARKANRAIKDQRPELILLDLNLDDDMSGWDLLEKLKSDPVKSISRIPVIIVTGEHKGSSDMVRAFKAGAEDYILKPFHPEVLAARVAAMLRRFQMLRQRTRTLIQLGPLIIDLGKRVVSLKKADIHLTQMEFDLLYYLARRANQTISTKKLLVDVWKTDPEVKTRTVQAHVDNLRKKLGSISKNIETIPAQGYRLSLKE